MDFKPPKVEIIKKDIDKGLAFVKDADPIYDEGLRLLNIEKYHKIYNLYGDGRDYCIIDDGTEAHPNVSAPRTISAHGYRNTRSAHGHGLKVQSINDMQGNPYIGIRPKDKPHQKKALGSQGGTFRDIASAVRAARAEGFMYIIMSLGAEYTVSDHELTEELRLCWEEGRKVCTVAGNENDEGKNVPINYPGNLPYVFTALSVDFNKKHSPFSNAANNKVERVYCIYGNHVITASLSGYHDKSSGTSFVAPLLSGIQRMIDEYFERLFGIKYTTCQEIDDILKSYAEDLGPSGFDKLTGNGLVSLRCIDDGFQSYLMKYHRDDLIKQDPEWNNIEEDQAEDSGQSDFDANGPIPETKDACEGMSGLVYCICRLFNPKPKLV